MTRISKFHLNQNQLQEIKEHFAFLISSLSNSNEIKNFLDEFLTKEEKIMLTKRLGLFMMLKRNFHSEAIKSALHVSYETVRTYQNQLQYKNSSFHQTIERLLKRENVINFFKKVEKILKPIDLAISAKRDMRARAKFASGDWTS